MILERIASESQGTLICAGDFNTVINGKWDTSNNKRNVSPQTKLPRKGRVDMGLLVIWRDIHPMDIYILFTLLPMQCI